MQNSITSGIPKEGKPLSSKEFQQAIKNQKEQVNADLDVEWARWKHRTKLILFFIIFPLFVALILLIYIICFIKSNWGNWEEIYHSLGFVLSYILTAIFSGVLTHYIEK